MKAILDGDLVLAVATGSVEGPDLPPAFIGVPPGRLRVVHGVVVDVGATSVFYIDDQGRKHAVAGDGWQELACGWSDPLAQDNAGVWSVLARVPASVSPRQFLIAMKNEGVITDTEALAAATAGTVPAAIDAIFAALPADDALDARITWAKMSSVDRANPLFGAVFTALGRSNAEVDDFFRAAAAI